MPAPGSRRRVAAFAISTFLTCPAFAGLRWVPVDVSPQRGDVRAMAVSSYFGGPFGSWIPFGASAVPDHGAFELGSTSPLCPECCADAQSVGVVGLRTFLVGTSCGPFVESVYGSGPAGPGLPAGALITAIAATPGAVYAGTSNAGVFRFTPGFFPGFTAESDGLPAGASVRMLGRGSSMLYLSLANEGLYEKAGSWKVATEGLPPSALVTAVGGLDTDFVAVSGKGLYRRRSDGTWVRTPAPVTDVSALRAAGGRLFAAAGAAGILKNVAGVWQRESAGLPQGLDARVLDAAASGGALSLIGETLYVGTAGQGVFSTFVTPVYRTLPCVADTEGNGGKRFRTELVIGNRNPRPHLGLFLNGEVLTSTASVEVPQYTEFRTTDAVAWLRTLGGGLPAGQPAGSLTTGFSYPYQDWSPDSVYMIARVYTSDGSGGTYGVTLGSTTDQDAAEEEGTVYGLRSVPGVDRSNLAVVHVPGYRFEPITLSVQVMSSTGTPAPTVLTKTLEPGEWFQWNDVLKLAGMSVGDSGYARITRTAGMGPWTAYGVINDAKTSDGAVLPLFRSGGAAALRQLLVPVVLDVAGEAGSHYTTELTLANGSARATSVEMTYRAAPGFGGGSVAAPTRLSLAAGEQRTIPDAIGFLRANGVAIPANESGAAVGTLLVEFRDIEDGLNEDTVVLARSTTPNPDRETGGRLGTAYSAVPWANGARQAALIPALSQDERSRSNVAVVNVGGAGSSSSLVLSVQLRDAATGKDVGRALQVALAPGDWHQWSRIAELAGTTSTQFTAFVTRVSGDDTFFAYGVVNDAKTSDGSFIEMIRLDGN